ncbi:MAG: arginase [Bacteroidia bacterium]|nr:arginase [Bacteroidia bacterium]NNC85045.1 arginase [Bacteroidia bacterium]NNM16420.1 arginase [Bacteroidia bacterium]
MSKKIKFVEVDSEIGAGTRGASMGIDAIKIAALDYGSDLFNKIKSVQVKTENDALFHEQHYKHAKRVDSIVKTQKRIATAVKSVLRTNTFPIILSGDHSSAAATIAGIKAYKPKMRLGVVWIDAHADLHTPYTTPSGNVHGMPLAACLGEDNKKNKSNRPSKETIAHWEELKNIGGISPKINYEDIVFIALRDFEKQERELIKKNGVKVYSVADVRKNGATKVARSVINNLDECDMIYVSFDVDSMDSAISKGTGTPVPDGITEKEAGNLCAYIVENEKVCCFEITEVNPTLDSENLMAENTFEILQKVIGRLKN